MRDAGLFQNKQIPPPIRNEQAHEFVDLCMEASVLFLFLLLLLMLLLLEWDENKVVRTIASMGLLCPF